MSGITRSIEELVTANPDVDNQKTFAALWQLTTDMFQRVRQRFDLTMDPCCANLQPYHGLSDSGASGYIGAYTGPEIDWLIHSWTGNPAASFTNMHLTISLGPQVDVPNFGFALGTVPDLFWYMDYLPRYELATHPDYADQYYGGEVNTRFIEMDRNSDFVPFVSRDLYTRVAQTPCSVCVSAPVSDDNLAFIRSQSMDQLERWLGWVEAATPVPEARRQALASRDLFVRRTICQRDPANVVVEKLFGAELGQFLVDTLWGGTRTLGRQRT